MTTPEIDFALPVSFTLVRQVGSDQLQRSDGGDHYRLAGPSVLAASWSGPQKAEIWHRHDTGAGWKWRKLAEFNGGGERLSELGQNPANQSWCTSVLRRLHRTWRRITGAHSRFIRSSRWGGGVNDRTTRRSLDALTGHQARHDGGQHTGPDSGRSWAERHSQRFLAASRCASAGLGFRRGPVDVDLPRVEDPVRDDRPAQGPHHPRHYGDGRDCETVRLDGGPVEANAAGSDDFPDSCVLVTASTGGGTLNDDSRNRFCGYFTQGSRVGDRRRLGVETAWSHRTALRPDTGLRVPGVRGQRHEGDGGGCDSRGWQRNPRRITRAGRGGNDSGNTSTGRRSGAHQADYGAGCDCWGKAHGNADCIPNGLTSVGVAA